MSSDSQLASIGNLMQKGEYKKSIQEIDKQISKDKNLSNDNMLLLICQKCTALNNIGKYEECILLARKLCEDARKNKRQIIEIDACLEEIFALYRLNRLEEVMEILSELESLIEKCSEKEAQLRKAQLLVYKIYIYTAKGDVTQANTFAQQNYYLSRDLKSPYHLAYAYHTLGWVNMEMGDINAAMTNYQQSLEIREEIGNQQHIAYTIFALGYLNRTQGNFDEAQKLFTRCLKIREKIGNQQDIAWTYLNLGDIQLAKGNLKEAQIHYDKSFLINKEMDFHWGIVFSLIRLSSIYEQSEDPQPALDTLEKALDYAQEVVENVDSEVYVLFDLINFITKRNLESNKIKEYMMRLEEITMSHTDSRIFDQICRLSNALVLKSSTDTRKRKKARVLLQEITNEEIIDFSTMKTAMINYSEILAKELKGYIGDEIILSELTELSDTLFPIQFQQSYSIVAESFLDQTMSALEEVDITKAKELLGRAEYFLNFLELYNKGSTPFRIMFYLFMRERNLNDLSKLLRITKGALSGHLKLLTSLDLVKISREKQVRSATMLKKYYALSSQGEELLKPFSCNLLESVNRKPDLSKSFIEEFMIPRLMVKMLQDTTFLINDYQNFIEEQVILKPITASKLSITEKKDLEEAKKFFNPENEININHFFLTDEQYKIYIKLWKDFNSKVKKEVILNNPQSRSTSVEKPKYVAHITLPLKEMLDLKGYLEKKRLEKRRKRSESEISEEDFVKSDD